MAINRKEFTEPVDTSLKATKDFTRFLLRFKYRDKYYNKLFDYSDKQWDKRTRISKAKSEALAYKSKVKNSTSDIGFNESSPLNKVAEAYFSKECSKTKWTDERKDSYRLYIEPAIGKRKIKDIRLDDINDIRLKMEKKGHTKQTINGCSPRTIKKALIQTLKPIMEYARDNKVIDDIPKITLSKEHTKENKSKKKKVDNAGVKLTELYATILDLYKDDPFYRALFLLALYGRRWGEIKTLEWIDVDRLNNTYTIRAENNKIGENQKYALPRVLLDALDQIDGNSGLIFVSPVTGKELSTPKKQLAKIKAHSGIEELTMHYFRHILVSAMGEMGTAGTVLSAALGHTNLKTVNDFYLSANHTKASQIANQTIASITNG
jgi:integrase